ncbi:hypothetical protein [Nonomuraea sp. NPDC049607]|uniref:hypothetical protein n=1 Tax=Nonomuraea sp. NPDC049607 TaxID=3154732 RepID=UPI003421DCFE
MTSTDDLLRELQSYLHGVTTSYRSSSDPNDVYEGYIFALVVTEALARGGLVHYEDVHGNKTSRLVFRTTPGRIYSRAHPYTHAVIQFGTARPLEAHVGVQVQGTSGVLHECDVLVLTADEAELSRSAGVAPKTKGCVLAIECKFYTSSLKLDLARSFQGLGADLGERGRPTFVSNGSSTTIKRYLSHKKRDWEHDVLPGNTQVDGLRSKIREAFKVYLSRADPTFSI